MDPGCDPFRQSNALQDFHVIYVNVEFIPDQIKAVSNGIPVNMKFRGGIGNIQHIMVPGGGSLYQREAMFNVIFRQQYITRGQQGTQDFFRQLSDQDIYLDIQIPVNMALRPDQIAPEDRRVPSPYSCILLLYHN